MSKIILNLLHLITCHLALWVERMRSQHPLLIGRQVMLFFRYESGFPIDYCSPQLDHLEDLPVRIGEYFSVLFAYWRYHQQYTWPHKNPIRDTNITIVRSIRNTLSLNYIHSSIYITINTTSYILYIYYYHDYCYKAGLQKNRFAILPPFFGFLPILWLVDAEGRGIWIL